MSQPFELGYVEVKAATPGAILVELGEEDVWIPKSAIHDDSEVYGEDHRGELIVKQWLAEKRGWA